jgi:hypothetical protein
MNLAEQDVKALSRVCGGKPDAMQWLALWREYVHAIDDVEDEPWGTAANCPEARQRIYVLALELYTHPFFKANEARLKQIVLNCTNAYADSLAWEKSGVKWQAEFADHYRHFGAEMVITVAQLCGGYDHARGISLELRETCWREHHDAAGRPV